VSMWLERTRGAQRATVPDSGSIMQSPDVRRRKSPEGIVFARAITIRHWNELLLGGAEGGGTREAGESEAGWRVCIAGLSRGDVARFDAHTAPEKTARAIGEYDRPALAFHGRYLGGAFKRSEMLNGAEAPPLQCQCPEHKSRARPDMEENIWPSLVKVGHVDAIPDSETDLTPSIATDKK
jgi:hypothetical protein